MPLIKYKKKTYAGGSMPVLEMTKAQYDALSEAKKNDGTIYLITDGTGGWEAERSTYDNSESGLTATNVQDAIDEVVDEKYEKPSGGIPASDLSSAVQTGLVYTTNISVGTGSSETYEVTFPGRNYRILFVGHNSVTNLNGIYLIPSPSGVYALVPASNLNVTRSGNNITIQNTGSAGSANGIII